MDSKPMYSRGFCFFLNSIWSQKGLWSMNACFGCARDACENSYVSGVYQSLPGVAEKVGS